MTDIDWIEAQEDFDRLLSETPEVVVKFTAPAWCRPCQQFAPHFEKAAEQSEQKFVAVDVDKAPWAMEVYGVRGVPTVARFINGERADDIKARTVVALINELK